MHGDRQCGSIGPSEKAAQNEIRSRELQGCRTPSMHPHTLHTQFATYRIFFPFEPIMELRKEVELNERKLRSFPQYITQLNLKECISQNPTAGGRGERNAAISLGKGQLHSN